MKLKAAVAGTGFIGPVHVEGLRRAGVEVVGILGSTPENSQLSATELGIEKAYVSFDEVLTDADIDCVHLATPNRLHFEQAKACIAAGKHVLCEKPLAMNSVESAELVRLAANANVACGVNYNIRYYPALPGSSGPSSKRNGRRRLPHNRKLFSGLVIPRNRLQLASTRRRRRRTASRRGHRHSLAGSRSCNHRFGSRGRLRRSSDRLPCPKATDRRR